MTHIAYHLVEYRAITFTDLKGGRGKGGEGGEWGREGGE